MPQPKKIRNKQKAIDDLLFAEKMFNDKIERLRREIPESIEYLPNYVDLRKTLALDNLPTRELRNLEKSLQRFIKDKAEMPYTTETGVTITVWEKEEIDREFDRINERRDRERDKFVNRYYGFINERSANLQERVNNVEKITPKGWNRWRSNLFKSYIYSNYEVKADQYKDNYLKAIEQNFGRGALYNLAAQADASSLMEAWYRNERLSIDFVYTIFESHSLQSAIIGALKGENVKGITEDDARRAQEEMMAEQLIDMYGE